MKRKISIKIYFLISFLSIIFVSLVLYTLVIYAAISKVFEQELEHSLISFSEEIEGSINFKTVEKAYIDQDFLQEQDEVFRFSLNEVVIQLRSKKGKSIAKSKKMLNKDLPFSEKWLLNVTKGSQRVDDFDLEINKGKRSYKILTYAAPKDNPQYILQVGVPKRYIYGNSMSLLKGLLYVVPLLMLFAFLVSYSLIQVSGKPILNLAEKVKSLKVDGFKERINTEFMFKEMDDLRIVVNELLEKIHNHIKANERFISNASHQLKTPLSILKNEIEFALSGEGGLEKVQIESISEEINILIEIVDKMLTLAKVDSSQENSQFYRLSLDEILMRAMKVVKRQAKSKSIEFKFNVINDTDDFSILGDEFLLISMFQSLLENAIKYSPQNTKIMVNLNIQGDKYLITIGDKGPGIEESEVDQLFERFYSKSQSEKGTGLGLAIAKQVADLHKIQLTIANRKDGGAKVSVEMNKN